MKKIGFLVFIAVFCIATIVKGQFIREDEKIEVILLSRDVVKKVAKNTTDYYAYYFVAFKNKTSQKIDSLYGTFSVMMDENLLDHVDFACFEPISSFDIGNEIVCKKYSILSDNVYSATELEEIKESQIKTDLLIKTEAFELKYKLVWLEVHYKNGQVYMIE